MTRGTDEQNDELESLLNARSGSQSSYIEQWRLKYPDPPPAIARLIAWQATNLSFAGADPMEIARLEACFEADERTLVAAEATARYGLRPREFFPLADVGRFADGPETEWLLAACAALTLVCDRIRTKTLAVPASLRMKFAEHIPQRADDIETPFDHELFLETLRQKLELQSRQEAGVVLDAVLGLFRSRLDIREALLFAATIPALLGREFLDSASILGEPKRPFDRLESMNLEVQEQFLPWPIPHLVTPIEGVAEVLRAFVDRAAFAQALSRLPEEAKPFWIGHGR